MASTEMSHLQILVAGHDTSLCVFHDVAAAALADAALHSNEVPKPVGKRDAQHKCNLASSATHG